MSIRAQQKLQTRQALLESARLLMNSGRGFGSLSLREVSRQAGIVPAGFYRHFADMESFGLALVAEVGDTFRDALRQVRHHELQQRGMIEASVEIFLGAVSDNRDQFLFLAREQYGGSLAVRQAIAELRQRITQDLARDLLALGRLPHLSPSQIDVLADLVVKTVFATLPELIDPPPPDHTAAAVAGGKDGAATQADPDRQQALATRRACKRPKRGRRPAGRCNGAPNKSDLNAGSTHGAPEPGDLCALAGPLL